MPHVISEPSASADFSTGITVPDNGDQFDDACDVVVSALSELAERAQAANLAAPGITTKTLPVKLISPNNLLDRFTSAVSSGFLYWFQGSVVSAGRLRFAIPVIGPGLKIIDVTAYLDNATFGGGAHAGLPATLPILTLYRQTPSTSVATSVGATTDTSASQAAYDAAHTIVITVNHTVLSGYDYYVDFTGETGANSAANKLCLTGIEFRVGMP